MTRQLDTFILAIQNGAEASATNTWMGHEPATRDQVARIRILLDDCTTTGGPVTRPQRIAMLQRVFPISTRPDPLTLGPIPVQSTKDLSKAQAAAFITAVYGHPAKGLTLETPLTEDGEWFLAELLKVARQQCRAVEAAYVRALVPA